MEPNLSQALHLMNGDAINDRIKQGKVVVTMIQEKKTDREIVDELYLRVFGRMPIEKEWTTIQQTLANSADQRQAALEDVFWALLNSKEFYFNH
jgi:UDP-glucose 6-dehydrogenase